MAEPVKEVSLAMGDLAFAAVEAANMLAALSVRSKERGHDSTAQACAKTAQRLLDAVAQAAGGRP